MGTDVFLLLCLTAFVYLTCLLPVYVLALPQTVPCEYSGHTLNCSNRGLQTVPLNLPEDTTVLDLSFNPIRTIQGHAFRRLEKLLHININNCQIAFIGKGVFYSQASLESLELSHNNISDASFQKGTFIGLSTLKSLDLRNNNINTIPDALCDISSLTTLMVKGVENLTFPDCFQTLQSLQVIEFSPCDIRRLSNNTFVYLNNSQIATLDLSNCSLTAAEAGVFKPFQKQLQSLDLSNNDRLGLRVALRSLFGLQQGNMTSINFANVNGHPTTGEDVQVTENDVRFLSNISTKELRLSSNGIVAFAEHVFKSLKYLGKFEVIDISHNQLQSLTALIAFRGIEKSLNNLRVLDLSYQPDSRLDTALYLNMLNVNLTSVKSIDSNTHESDGQLPKNLEVFKIAHCRAKVPLTLASVNISTSNNIKEIDVSYSTFASLGTICGLDRLEKFDISGLEMCNFTYDFFVCMHGLKELRAANSTLGVKFARGNYEHFFKGLINISSLELSSNGLSKSNLPSLKDLSESIEKVNLSKNDLSSLPFDPEPFHKMRVLDLSFNTIESLSEAEQSHVSRFIESKVNFTLYLEGNPMKCTCDQLEFVTWLCNIQTNVPDFRAIKCADYQSGSSKFLPNFCGKMDTFRKDCAMFTGTIWLKISISMLTMLLFSLLVAVLLYRYNTEIRYLILEFCSRARRYEPIPHFIYDAFMAFSHLDDDWVNKILRTRLEHDHTLKLCLHQRKFTPGAPISHNIIDAIEQSRKVIFVVTYNSLKSDWVHFELEMANMHRSIRRRNNLIIIMRDNIPYEDMPKTLRAIWRNTVCLVWPESEKLEDTNQFWRNLASAIKA